MPGLVKKIEEKLQEYGMSIYDHYDIDGSDDEHVFLVEEMIVFIRNETKSASISYQATTRPDVAARNLLILSEVNSLEYIDVMDSFIYDENNEIVSGEDAYDLIKETKRVSIISEYLQEQTMKQIFNKMNCDHYTC